MIKNLGDENLDPDAQRRLTIIRGIPWEQLVELVCESLAFSSKPITLMKPGRGVKSFGESGFDPMNDSPICHQFTPKEACDELMRRTEPMKPKSNARRMSSCGCFLATVIASLIAGAAWGFLIRALYLAS